MPYQTPTLVGKSVSLRPMTLDDKETFFQWATHSDSTAFWYGERYGDDVPDRTAFFNDWTDDYFTDAHPGRCRSFAIGINSDKREIGQVNFQAEDIRHSVYDLDIIIASDRDKGKGYGSESLKLLADYLINQFDARLITIYALTQNYRAIRSYVKAGFSLEKTFPDEAGRDWIQLTIKK